MRLTSGEVLLRWPLSTHILTAGWTYNDGSAHNDGRPNNHVHRRCRHGGRNHHLCHPDAGYEF